jgi:hypothetical protein
MEENFLKSGRFEGSTRGKVNSEMKLGSEVEKIGSVSRKKKLILALTSLSSLISCTYVRSEILSAMKISMLLAEALQHRRRTMMAIILLATQQPHTLLSSKLSTTGIRCLLNSLRSVI